PTVEILPSVDRQAEGTLIPLSFSAESKTKASRAVPSGRIPDTSSPRASHPDTPVPQSPDGLRSTAAPLRDFPETQSSRLNPGVHRSRRACPRSRTARQREHHPDSASSNARAAAAFVAVSLDATSISLAFSRRAEYISYARKKTLHSSSPAPLVSSVVSGKISRIERFLFFLSLILSFG